MLVFGILSGHVMKTLYRGAQAYVSIARRLSAAFYFVGALLLITFALWLAYPFGNSWLLTANCDIGGIPGMCNGCEGFGDISEHTAAGT